MDKSYVDLMGRPCGNRASRRDERVVVAPDLRQYDRSTHETCARALRWRRTSLPAGDLELGSEMSPIGFLESLLVRVPEHILKSPSALNVHAARQRSRAQWADKSRRPDNGAIAPSARQCLKGAHNKQGTLPTDADVIRGAAHQIAR